MCREETGRESGRRKEAEITGENDTGESDKEDEGWSVQEKMVVIQSQELVKPVGEEEAMRPNKTDIDVALAAVPRRVTRGQVSNEKLNRANTILLPPAHSYLNQGCIHR